MKSSDSYAWCPECKKWVPFEDILYDEETRTSVCSYCLDGIETDFVYDPHHNQTQCIYCDSWDTTELAPDWRKFKCNECGEVFKIL